MKLFIEVVNHLASKYYGNGGWTSITRLPASWLNLQVLGKMCISKIFQNTNPKSIKHLVSPFRSHPKAPGQAIPLRKYPFFFSHGTTAGSFEPIVYVYVEFGLPWISWWGLRTEHLGEEWHRPVIGISGQSNVWVILGPWDLQNRPFFLLKNSPKCLFATICKWCKTWVPCSFHDGNLSPKGSYGKDPCARLRTDWHLYIYPDWKRIRYLWHGQNIWFLMFLCVCPEADCHLSHSKRLS